MYKIIHEIKSLRCLHEEYDISESNTSKFIKKMVGKYFFHRLNLDSYRLPKETPFKVVFNASSKRIEINPEQINEDAIVFYCKNSMNNGTEWMLESGEIIDWKKLVPEILIDHKRRVELFKSIGREDIIEKMNSF